MFRLSYKIMLLFTILVTIAGIITLFPSSAANYPNLIGYKSVCTFTPAATFFCFFIAGLSCFIRSTFIKDQSGSKTERFHRHKKSLIALSLVFIVASLFTYKYIEIKTPYIDGTAAASFEI
ncbi:MAG: hypothetical protein OCD02_00405 [Spirochaetaceae bacterium]